MGDYMNDETEFNEGHIVEGLSYCTAVMSLLEELLEDHPAVVKSCCQDEVDKACDAIAEIYRRIGGIE